MFEGDIIGIPESEVWDIHQLYRIGFGIPIKWPLIGSGVDQELKPSDLGMESLTVLVVKDFMDSNSI